MAFRTTKAQVLESNSVRWRRKNDLNPFYTRPNSGWNSDTIDTIDIVPNPNDESELYYLYSAREASGDEDNWDIGLAYIDLNSGIGSITNDPDNPVYSHPDGIGDPTIIYNADESPYPFQMWVWGEDGSNNDIIRYYHGDAIDTMVEDANSPVITVSAATGSSLFQPSLTFDTVADEYVLLLTEETTSGFQTYKWTSTDGVSWTERGEVTSYAAVNEIVKYDGTEHFYRPRRRPGSDAWFAMSHQSSSPTLLKSTDRGDSWSVLYSDPFVGADEDWEAGPHGDYVMLPDPTSGQWLLYYKGGPSGGTAKGFGVATAPEFPGERPEPIGAFPRGTTPIALPLADSTIACYTMGQTQGAQIHDTANGRHAPRKGTTSWVSASAWPWPALQLDGSSGYISLSQYDGAIQDGQNPLSVCLAFDAELNGNLTGLKSFFSHDGRLELQYDPSATQFRFRAYDSTDSTAGVATISATTASGSRHVVIGSFDPNAGSISISLDGEMGADGMQDRWDKSSSEVAFGARGDGGAQYFPGDLAFASVEQRVWDAQTQLNYTEKLLNA